MAVAQAEIQAFTAASFSTPDKFTKFCDNGGKPLGGDHWGQKRSRIDECHTRND